MIKKFTAIFISSLFLIFNTCVGFADGDIQTEYPLEEMIIQYEFNDEAAGMEGLSQHYSDHPFTELTTEDGEGVAKFVTPELQTCGFKILKLDDRLAVLEEKLKTNIIVFEYRVKASTGMHLVFSNKQLHYISSASDTTAYFSISDKRIPGITVNDDEWFTVVLRADYTSGTGKIVGLEINGTLCDTSAHSLPALDTLYGGAHNMRYYTNLNETSNKRSLPGSVAYMDYLRVYSMKEIKLEGSDIEDTTSVDVDTAEFNLTYSQELDETSASQDVALLDEAGNSLDITSGVGEEPNILKITLNEPLIYSRYYKLDISGLREKYDSDKVKVDTEIEFFVENKPFYNFDNISVIQSGGKLSGTADLTNNLPKSKDIVIVSQFYDEDGKLVGLAKSDEITVAAYTGQAENIQLFSDASASNASNVKLYIFESDYTKVIASFEAEIER
ncbi:MAG: hypothetical protein IJC74_00625 [Clostridia bacterium]|nr:hypothetical protein [Clostridia bacterium]